MTSAKVILDSTNGRHRLTTLQLRYPRFIHAEFMTHRMFSRNASSSRAIPVAKMIEQVRTDPAMPIHWGKNQPGMQARSEIEDIPAAISQWRFAANQAADRAEAMNNLSLHKQVANRILEPFQWMHVIVTATDWENFFKLRLHPDAEPNIYELARVMDLAMAESVPITRNVHLPYINPLEEGIPYAAMISAARCARVSYLNHDGTYPDLAKDFALAQTLQEAGHASPFEHVAFADPDGQRHANFAGWRSLRSKMGI